MMDKQTKIFVAGHRGMVGSAIVRRLRAEGYANLLLGTRDQLDLCNQAAVEAFFRAERPDYVFMAAAKVGGILANSSQPAEFIYDNLQIQLNIIHNAWLAGVKRLLFLGSTCIYPKNAPQPMREEHLLASPLEPTNDAYAVAKIAGIYQCRSYNRQYGTRFLAAMPNNLYGVNDNFDLEKSHVLPALIRKFHEAKVRQVRGEGSGVRSEKQNPSPLTPHPSPDDNRVVVWGSGSPLREFLHVDDLADACLFLMNLDEATYDRLLHDPVAPALINVGSGQELSIRDLALLVKRVVGFEGELVFDAGKPDGTPRKLADASRIHALGWRHRIGLEEGIAATYQWYRDNLAGDSR